MRRYIKFCTYYPAHSVLSLHLYFSLKKYVLTLKILTVTFENSRHKSFLCLVWENLPNVCRRHWLLVEKLEHYFIILNKLFIRYYSHHLSLINELPAVTFHLSFFARMICFMIFFVWCWHFVKKRNPKQFFVLQWRMGTFWIYTSPCQL